MALWCQRKFLAEKENFPRRISRFVSFRIGLTYFSLADWLHRIGLTYFSLHWLTGFREGDTAPPDKKIAWLDRMTRPHDMSHVIDMAHKVYRNHVDEMPLSN